MKILILGSGLDVQRCFLLQNANILHAVLSLIKELDMDSLESVVDAVRNKMESL